MFAFNEASGTDANWNNLGDAYIYGTAGWADDPVRGSVLSFDKTNYADAGMLPEITADTDFTISFWANSSETAVSTVMLGNRYTGNDADPSWIKFTPSQFEYVPHYVTAGVSYNINYADVPTGEWVHHAVVKSGTTFTYYRNGYAQGANTSSAAMPSIPVRIRHGFNGTEAWTGSLDDVVIYNTALTNGGTASSQAFPSVEFMKSTFAAAILGLIIAGCKAGPASTTDPFFGNTRVAPPPTGSAQAIPPGSGYYQSAPSGVPSGTPTTSVGSTLPPPPGTPAQPGQYIPLNGGQAGSAPASGNPAASTTVYPPAMPGLETPTAATDDGNPAAGFTISWWGGRKTCTTSTAERRKRRRERSIRRWQPLPSRCSTAPAGAPPSSIRMRPLTSPCIRNCYVGDEVARSNGSPGLFGAGFRPVSEHRPLRGPPKPLEFLFPRPVPQHRSVTESRPTRR